MAQRKRGRPPARGEATTITLRVRLTTDEHAALGAHARERGVSMSQLVIEVLKRRGLLEDPNR